MTGCHPSLINKIVSTQFLEPIDQSFNFIRARQTNSRICSVCMNISNRDLKLEYFNPNILVICLGKKKKIGFRLLLKNEMNRAWKYIFKQWSNKTRFLRVRDVFRSLSVVIISGTVLNVRVCMWVLIFNAACAAFSFYIYSLPRLFSPCFNIHICYLLLIIYTNKSFTVYKITYLEINLNKRKTWSFFYINYMKVIAFPFFFFFC